MVVSLAVARDGSGSAAVLSKRGPAAVLAKFGPAAVLAKLGPAAPAALRDLRPAGRKEFAPDVDFRKVRSSF
jgi:hypothetical protein